MEMYRMVIFTICFSTNIRLFQAAKYECKYKHWLIDETTENLKKHLMY